MSEYFEPGFIHRDYSPTTITREVEKTWQPLDSPSGLVTQSALRLRRIYGNGIWRQPDLITQELSLTLESPPALELVKEEINKIHAAAISFYPLVDWVYEHIWSQNMSRDEANETRDTALERVDQNIWDPRIEDKIKGISIAIRYAPRAVWFRNSRLFPLQEFDTERPMSQTHKVWQDENGLVNQDGAPVFESVPLPLVAALVGSLSQSFDKAVVLAKLGYFSPAFSTRAALKTLGIERSDSFYQRRTQSIVVELEAMKATDARLLQPYDFKTLVSEVKSAFLVARKVRINTYGHRLLEVVNRFVIDGELRLNPFQQALLSERERRVVEITYNGGLYQSANEVAKALGIPLSNVIDAQKKALAKLEQTQKQGTIYNPSGEPLSNKIQEALVLLNPNPYLLAGLRSSERKVYVYLTAQEGSILRHTIVSAAKAIGTDSGTIYNAAKNVLRKLQRNPEEVVITTSGEIKLSSPRGRIIQKLKEDKSCFDRLPEPLRFTAFTAAKRVKNDLYLSNRGVALELGIGSTVLKYRLKKIARLLLV